MKVIIISGPTASGKTQTSIELATKFGGEIVNFDSLLLYREINIGTAKPSWPERKSVPHHMLDVASIAHPMNASEYAKMALPLINELLTQKKIVYLVGGSGFYLQALMMGMYDSPTTSPEVSLRSEQLYETEGITPFLEILKLHDLESFKRYHENDHYRIRRAVEHWWSNHSPLSEVRSKKDETNRRLRLSNIHNWDLLHIYLDLPRPQHSEIIIHRTRKMLQDGLVEEVMGLLESGFTGREKPLQSIGYKETLDFINGIYADLRQCEERIVTSTRQLAKSQRTWFNRDQQKYVFHPLNDRTEIHTKLDCFLHNAP